MYNISCFKTAEGVVAWSWLHMIIMMIGKGIH